MKHLVLAIAAVALASCASAPKKECCASKKECCKSAAVAKGDCKTCDSKKK